MKPSSPSPHTHAREHGHGHGHGHAHGHAHAHAHGSGRNLRTAFLLNLSFTGIELVGGLLTNSIAILSDAVHDLGDSLSLGTAWYFDRVSRRGRTARDTYGLRRYALLGGLFTALVLMVGLGFVLWQAIARLWDPQPVHAPGMMALAVLGVAFNGAAVLRVRSGTSLTERVVSWHLLEDTLGWVAVLVGAAAMTVWDAPWIDPALSIGISVFILWNVVRNLRRFFDVFLQRAPHGFDQQRFEEAVRAIPGVHAVRHTHSWSIDGESHVMTTHLVMDAGCTRHDILAAKRRVRALVDPHGYEHLTVEVELAGEESLHGPASRGADP